MLMKPTDLDRLHPNEITRWLDNLADDDTVTTRDWTVAQYAAAVALGVPEAGPDREAPDNPRVEARQRSYQGVGEAMSADDRNSLSPGAAEVRDRFAVDFQHTLFDRPDLRKRWTLRHRSKESVAEVADRLAWSVGANLDQIVPTESLGNTVRAAVIHDFTDSIEMFAEERVSEGIQWWHLNLMPSVAKTLDWYIRCFPGEAHSVIGEIQSQAHKLWQVPAADTLAALQSALSLDGEPTEQQRETYFALLEPHTDPS